MSNKRVSQLTQLTAPEARASDLLYVIDVSAREGKNITLEQLSTFLNLSGSIIAMTSINADSASYILGSGVRGIVTASLSSIFSSVSISASWASSSISSSHAVSASYAINGGVGSSVSASWASSSISSSYSTFSQNAINSTNAGFLVYAGVNNGTSSYSKKSEFTDNVRMADTASYLNQSIASVASSSWSDRAGHTDSAMVSTSTNYLNFVDGYSNGTASYALSAGGYVSSGFKDYGMSLATTQSMSSSHLDFIQVTSSLGTEEETIIDVYGTVIIPFTSSVLVNELLHLVVKDRDGGVETTIDTVPVYLDMSGTVNNWDDVLTGSIKMPYTLMGSSSLYGRYEVFITGSSSKIQIDSSRLNRFKLTSKSDTLGSGIDEPLLFNITPLSTAINFSSSVGGPFTDDRDGIISSGSSEIWDINVRQDSFVSSIRYVWSLTNLKSFDCGENLDITTIGKMPNTLETMSCDSCSINKISSLSNTSIATLNCGFNYLKELPLLPSSTSYLDCSSNLLTYISDLPESMSFFDASKNDITFIPPTFPFGLTELYLSQNNISSVFSTLPNSIVTMSFADNPSMIVFEPGIPGTSSMFPTTLEKFDISNTRVSSVPELPVSLSYFNGSYCGFGQPSMNAIFSQSYSNALLNGLIGSIFLNGNGPVMISTENDYIIPLQEIGWTITYDGSV